MNKILALAQQHERALALVAVIVLVLLGNGLLAITDPVESNYALTAKEMLASGDFTSPRIYGNYWYDKPIFFYWELALSFAVFGFNDWAARFPSAVLGCVNVLFLFWFARRVYDERTAWTASITSPSAKGDSTSGLASAP